MRFHHSRGFDTRNCDRSEGSRLVQQLSAELVANGVLLVFQRPHDVDKLFMARATCCMKLSLQMNLMICISEMLLMTDSLIHMLSFSIGISQPTCDSIQRIVRVLW